MAAPGTVEVLSDTPDFTITRTWHVDGYEDTVTIKPSGALQAVATRDANVRAIHDTLRTWAATARSTTVTSGNAVAVLQTIVGELASVYDRLADLLEILGRS